MMRKIDADFWHQPLPLLMTLDLLLNPTAQDWGLVPKHLES